MIQFGKVRKIHFKIQKFKNTQNIFNISVLCFFLANKKILNLFYLVNQIQRSYILKYFRHISIHDNFNLKMGNKCLNLKNV